MGLINWEKPKKINSTEAHNNYYVSDSGVAGTYVPNMSREDMRKWKGKKFIKTDKPRIEIRKTAGAQILIVVSKNEPNFVISANGKIEMNKQEMQEFFEVIKEASQLLIEETNEKA